MEVNVPAAISNDEDPATDDLDQVESQISKPTIPIKVSHLSVIPSDMPKERIYQTKEDTDRMRDSILLGIKQLCDVFSPYSYESRKLFLEEI